MLGRDGLGRGVGPAVVPAFPFPHTRYPHACVDDGAFGLRDLLAPKAATLHFSVLLSFFFFWFSLC